LEIACEVVKLVPGSVIISGYEPEKLVFLFHDRELRLAG